MTANSAGYSAQVEMYLIVHGRKLEIGQLGPAHCIVRKPVPVLPGVGEIVVIVDGSESRTPVDLPDGIAADVRRVAYRSTAPVAVVQPIDLTHPSPLSIP